MAKIQLQSFQQVAQAELLLRSRKRSNPDYNPFWAEKKPWPRRHVSDNGTPAPFHAAQNIAFDSERRIVAMSAGSQSGKTSFGPWWLRREIKRRGRGDYIAVTASYDLFKLKMLPSFLEVFEHILKLGRYWTGDKIFEIRDPHTGQFWANSSTDPMYARVILRSAQSEGGLESATAQAAWLDEAGQDEFSVQAYRGIRRRVAISRGPLLITTTLYNLGWMATDIIGKAEKNGEVSIEQVGDGEIITTDNPDADICLIQFDSIINPRYSTEEFNEMRDILPSDEFDMQMRGRIARPRFLIYDCFDAQEDTCPPFEIPRSWKRYVGVDFGGVNTAAVYYAEEPDTHRLYAYREYHEGGRRASEHAVEIMRGEPGIPFGVGGARSEGQWRMEFSAGGLPLRQPRIIDVNLGIRAVYAQNKQHRIIYFNNLHGLLDQKGKYRWKRDKTGRITDDIEDKAAFHFCDAERYIVSYIRAISGSWTSGMANG